MTGGAGNSTSTNSTNSTSDAAAGVAKTGAPAAPLGALGLNTTQLFLSLDFDGDGVVTFVDITDYCTEQVSCDAAEVAGALRLEADESAPGVDLAGFVDGIDADTVIAAGQDIMAAIVVAAAAEGEGEGTGRANAKAKAKAMARCVRAGEQWLPCATTNECYKTKTQCDGGAPDCADGSDEDPALCNTTPAPSSLANKTAASRAGTAAPSGGDGGFLGFGLGTVIAIAGIALLVVAGVVVFCCCQCRKGGGGASSIVKYEPGSKNNRAARATLARMNGEADDGDQVQGLSMSFANPAFKAPQPYNDDGELYETNEVPQPSYESIQDSGKGAAGPSYADMEYAGAVAGPSYSAVDEAAAGKGKGSGKARAYVNGGAGAPGGDTSYLDIAAQPPGQAVGGSTAMDVATPSYDAIDDAKDGDATYDVATNALFAGGPGQQDYDHDFPMQGAYGKMEDPPQRVYNLEDPTKAGHDAPNYDLGHTEASGNARVGHSSHYGNTADGYFAVAPQQHTSYDHDSLSEEEI